MDENQKPNYICAYCNTGYYPPPLPTQFDQQNPPIVPCSQSYDIIYISADANKECQENVTSPLNQNNCEKHFQIGKCVCENYENACKKNMDGSLEKPYDNLFNALFFTEKKYEKQYNLNLSFILLKGKESQKTTFQDSSFENFNDAFWRVENHAKFVAKSPFTINVYSIGLAQFAGELIIDNSIFSKAIPFLHTQALFCSYTSEMVGYVEGDSQKKLWFPGYSQKLTDYSDILNSHIVLIDTLARIDIRNSKFLNNTSNSGPALTTKENFMLSHIDLINKKSEIFIYKNIFEMNFGLMAGSVIRIMRKGPLYTENYCGPIYLKENIFQENYGCRTNFAIVNIQCFFQGEFTDSGIQKAKDIKLDEDIKTYASKELQAPQGYKDKKGYNLGLSKGFIADSGFLMKESSAVLLDLCDKIQIIGNTFDKNWSVSTGDYYIGSSLNIFRSISFHGIFIQNNLFKNHEGNGKCMIHLIGGDIVQLNQNQFINNDNDYFDSNNKQGIWGYICTTDKLGILAKSNGMNQITIQGDEADENFIDFYDNKGKLITHYSNVSKLMLKGIKIKQNKSKESLIDIISTAEKTEIINIKAFENSQYQNGIINIMDSKFVEIQGAQIQNNIPKMISCISILNSQNTEIKQSNFTNNTYIHDFRLAQPSLVVNYQYYSTPIMVNSSNVIFDSIKLNRNIASHGGGIFVSAISTITVKKIICEKNNAFSGGCIYSEKNSIINILQSQFKENIVQYAGGAISLFSQSELNDKLSIFQYNQAENGGCIFSSTSFMDLDKSIIEENKSLLLASAISNYIGKFNLKFIHLNKNISNGNSLIYSIEGVGEILSCFFSDNYASRQSYGIRAIRSFIIIKSSSFLKTDIDKSDIYQINGGFIRISEGNTIVNKYILIQKKKLKKQIEDTKFNNGMAFNGGSIFSGFEAFLQIKNCHFFSDEVISQGGNIYSFLSSKIEIISSSFQESISQQKGSNIYAQGVRNIIISGCEFSKITGNSIYGLNVFNFKIDQGSKFINIEQQNQEFQFSEIAIQSQGFECQMCDNIEIQNTSFQNLLAHKGSAILIDNDYLTVPCLINIKDSVFENNKAYQGGAIYLSGNISGNIIDTLFQSNIAYQPLNIIYLKNESGIGGGVLYNCPRINKDCVIKFTNAKFYSNTATLKGGGIQWNDKPLHIESNFEFKDNKAVYGNNIASYAVCVIKVDTIQDTYKNSICFNRQIQKGREIITRFAIDNFVSGQSPEDYKVVNSTKVENLSFALVDHYDNRIKSDNSSKITMIPIAKLTKDDTGWEKIFIINGEEFAQQGIFSFKRLKLITVPGSIIELSVITNGIPFRLNRQIVRILQEDNQIYKKNTTHLEFNSRSLQNQMDIVSQLRESSDATIQMELRKCSRGEIMKDDYTCYECPRYEFSLDDTQDIQLGGECQKCDNKVSLCQGGYFMGPLPEYWRLDSYKKHFHKCPKKGVCLGYIDLSFQSEYNFVGKCNKGHTGNLCDYCIEGFAIYQNQYCVQCTNNNIYWIRVFFTVVIAFIQVCWTIRSTLLQNQQPMKRAAILMKMMMNFIQSIFIFTTFNFQLPQEIVSFVSTQNELAAASLQMFNFNCLYKASIFLNNNIRVYFAQTIVISLAPLILVFFVVIFWVILYYIEYGNEAFKDSFYKKEITNKLIASSIIIQFTILPKILDLTLKAYKCVNLGDDDNPMLFLKADYDVKCWDKTHWQFIIFVALPSLLIWGIICPIFFYQKLVVDVFWSNGYQFSLSQFQTSLF
ncbi:hypothetical protein IMG5_005490 [Ichthyophthirius multifiliis]|uniref:Transmembrane protein n=1 Tax=Ichthyophthirius multifiliis TaxID=5932 RepID=G0QJH6_ICHMU|nr:hypothetical protein IMG5_005490 [Ichthyophthirius multifiliis]EGR34627.1 hypothetical protein IMG5_005490 [Ichthyophthirius multifiliis]|eukprot:XP_004039931.1 hypothetical protein IMG5_005490 [Ichthyophthirius multifiliis]